MVDRGRYGAKHAHRSPDHQHAARDAEAHARLLQRVELRRDEVELPRKIAQHETQNRRAIALVRGDAAENGKGEKKKREQGEQCVVRDG